MSFAGPRTLWYHSCQEEGWMWYWPALSLNRELETLTWSRKNKGRKSDSIEPPVRPFRKNRGRTGITLVSSYRNSPIYSTNCPDGRREARAWKADWVFWLSQLRQQQPLDLEAQVSIVIYILGRAHKSLSLSNWDSQRLRQGERWNSFTDGHTKVYDPLK